MVLEDHKGSRNGLRGPCRVKERSTQGQEGTTVTFGDGGHGQGDGDLEVVDGAADPGAAVDGVVEVADVDEPDGDADSVSYTHLTLPTILLV